jgi:NADH-quinone oxidoreductase subunit N
MIFATAVQIAPLATPHVDWRGFAPEMALGMAAILIVIARSTMRKSKFVYNVAFLIAGLGVLASIAFTGLQWAVFRSDGAFTTFGGMIVLDGFSIFIRVVVLIALVLVLVLSFPYLKREEIPGPEYLALLLLSASGMLIMGSANNLITVFLALEILSIALYVLVAIDRRRITSQEAALKYFILGAVASAIFLYGVALTYGATGTTSIPGIAAFLSISPKNGLLLMGLVLMIVGLGFKAAAAPFHMWSPDVYQGAPTPITAFMASATKAAAFAALLRVLITAFPAVHADWQPVLFALAALSLLVGSASALIQTDVKRMLAYSSISHAGFILIAVQAGTIKGVSAALFYLFTYTFMTIGSFAVVLTVAGKGDADHRLDTFRGLGRRSPGLAAIMTIFLLAQAGTPLTGGFVAKLGVFAAGVDAHQYGLVVIGVTATAVAAFLYLRIIIAMYLSDDEGAEAAAVSPITVPVTAGAVIGIALLATLFLGFFPGVILHFAHDAVLLR